MGYKLKERQREFNRLWIAKRRSDYFIDKQCAWCGSKDKLQIHHLDPSIKESHAVWSWTEERRVIELAKCIILCKNCHTGFHWKLLTKPLIHGTMNGYKGKGCRCSLCRRANADRSIKTRKLKKDRVLKE